MVKIRYASLGAALRHEAETNRAARLWRVIGRVMNSVVGLSFRQERAMQRRSVSEGEDMSAELGARGRPDPATAHELVIRTPIRGRLVIVQPVGHLHRASRSTLVEALNRIAAERPEVIVVDLDYVWFDDDVAPPAQVPHAPWIPVMLLAEDPEQRARARSSRPDGCRTVHRDLLDALRAAIALRPPAD